MRLIRSAFLGSALAAALSSAACGDETNTGGGGSTGTTSAMGCSGDTRAMKYQAGMVAEAADRKVKISLVEATPAPPARGDNSFTLDVTDGGGAAIEGAAIAVKAFMPDHGHGSSVAPSVSAGAESGRYQVSEVDLFMPGIWEITFTVTPSGGEADPVKLTFCVAD